MTNTARILEEIVSLEAWHSPFQIDLEAPFHVAISFSEGRFVGGNDKKISFKVSLKRATLVVVADENLQAPKRSKVREYPGRSVQVEREFSEGVGRKGSVGCDVEASVESDPKGPSGALKTRIGVEREHSESVQSGLKELEQVTRKMRMTHYRTGVKDTWKIAPIDAPYLEGLCCNGEDPLMQLKPMTDTRLEDLSVRVFVQCDAEDIEITEIDLDKSIIEKLKGENLEKRKKIAKEVIREKMAEKSLEIVDLGQKYQEVIIADLLAVPE